MTSDYRLAHMRRQQQGRYLVPRGGAFRFLFIAEPDGRDGRVDRFALMAWSLPALAFALWTRRQPDSPRPLAPPLVPPDLPRLPAVPPRAHPGRFVRRRQRQQHELDKETPDRVTQMVKFSGVLLRIRPRSTPPYAAIVHPLVSLQRWRRPRSKWRLR